MNFENPSNAIPSEPKTLDKKKALAAVAMLTAGGAAQAENAVNLDIDPEMVDQAREAFLSDGEISPHEAEVLAGMEHALETGKLPPKKIGRSSESIKLNGQVEVEGELLKGTMELQNSITRTRNVMSPEAAQKRAREMQESEAGRLAEQRERLVEQTDSTQERMAWEQERLVSERDSAGSRSEQEKVQNLEKNTLERGAQLTQEMAEREAEILKGMEQIEQMMSERLKAESARRAEVVGNEVQVLRQQREMADQKIQELETQQEADALSDEQWMKQFTQEMRKKFGTE